MAKASTTRWICSACHAEHSGWFGKCPACNAWNTVEERIKSAAPDRVMLASGAAAIPIPIPEVRDEAQRRPSGIIEVDRVLGGGFVAGSVVLLHGAPGIGKSTLLLQIGAAIARRRSGQVLYVSGEESVAQIAGRATRLRADDQGVLLVAETRIEPVLDVARSLTIPGELAMLVVDSIQTVYSNTQEGLPGNVSQIRSVCAQLISFAKQHDVPVVIVGHITKDGQLAGPRVLEHMVDAVLSFEGNDDRATRMLRATKNRFGSTSELGVFEMGEAGLLEIPNPSEVFLAQRPKAAPGSCVTVSLQGSRPLLLEVQALLANAGGGNPRRHCVGADPARLAMLLAVLDRHGDAFVLDQDVFVNVAGGLRLTEPAADLAVLLAVASSHIRKPIPNDLVALGEVGLTGELRQVTYLDARLAEAGRLGFRHAVVAPSIGRELSAPKGLRVTTAATVREALAAVFER